MIKKTMLTQDTIDCYMLGLDSIPKEELKTKVTEIIRAAFNLGYYSGIATSIEILEEEKKGIWGGICKPSS